MRSDAEIEAMRGQMPNRADYEYLIEEDAHVIGPEGDIAKLVPNAVTKKVNDDSAALFREVHGELSNRGSVVYEGSMMHRERPDNSLSFTKIVAPSILQLLREQNSRLGLTGPFSDFLGYMDKDPRNPFCRPTAWSLERPDVLEMSRPLVKEVEYVNKQELPHHWRRQREFMSSVSPDFKYNDSMFSTVTANLNLRCCYHTDDGDFRGGMGNLVVLELGDDESGILVMPRLRIAFLVRPTDCLLMDVHQMHGNLPLTAGGTRSTAVLYAREHLDKCP